MLHFVRVAAIIAVCLLPEAEAQKPGLHEHTLSSGGKDRAYLVHVPKGYSKTAKKKLPLVVMLHGRTSNGKQAASSYYGWRKLADEEKFIVAFPTALGRPTSWKGAWRGKPTEDSNFLSALIDHLVKTLHVDADRVFMTGHSSGGFMSYSFAATNADKVAAIGPVAGLMVGQHVPSSPVSVISFHGMADDVVAYDDDHGKRAAYKGMPSAIESAAHFAKCAACAERKRTEEARGKVKVDTWAGGRRGTNVVLHSIVDGDHGWPKKRSHGIDATKTIWEFFEKNARKTVEPAGAAK